MQPCNFPSFEKKLRVSQTRMIAAINLLLLCGAAVASFYSYQNQDWNLSDNDVLDAPSSVKWRQKKMTNLSAFSDIYGRRYEVFSKLLFDHNLRKIFWLCYKGIFKFPLDLRNAMKEALPFTISMNAFVSSSSSCILETFF